jgi:hypothetical protein
MLLMKWTRSSLKNKALYVHIFTSKDIHIQILVRRLLSQNPDKIKYKRVGNNSNVLFML